jgi:gluconokinase
MVVIPASQGCSYTARVWRPDRRGSNGGGIILQQRPLHQPEPASMAVIVMGVSGSGKSTTGALLAESLHCPFLEGDSFHDANAVEKMRSGVPLTDDDRWPWLDRIGAALNAAIAEHGMAVAACSALRRSYRDRLRAGIDAPTRFVLLDNDRDEIMRRMALRAGHYMPASLLDSQFATLERPAADEPATALFTRDTPEALTQAALLWLGAPVPSR